jgi:hypothetical protein
MDQGSAAVLLLGLTEGMGQGWLAAMAGGLARGQEQPLER